MIFLSWKLRLHGRNIKEKTTNSLFANITRVERFCGISERYTIMGMVIRWAEHVPEWVGVILASINSKRAVMVRYVLFTNARRRYNDHTCILHNVAQHLSTYSIQVPTRNERVSVTKGV